MALAHSPRIVRDSLIIYLDAGNTKSYPGSGTTWKDICGKNNDGTLVNSPTFDSNNLGSFDFDGSDERLNLFDPVGIYSKFSIDIWHKRGAQTDKYLYSESNSASGSPIWGITSHTGSNNSQLRIYARNNAGTGEVNFQPSGAEYTIYDDQIHNLVVVYESNNLYFYHDGSSIGSTSWSKGNYSNLDINSVAGWRGGSIGAGGYMNGNVYSVKTYSRSLTAAEVKQNYDALKGRFGL